jgi:hypothetical protein
MFDITVNGYHLPTLAKVIRDMGSPTEGPVAAIAWNISVRASVPAEISAQFLEAAGYEPFQGYPLERKRE